MLRTNAKSHQLIKHGKTSYPQIFAQYLPKLSKARYLKTDAPQVPQKVPAMLVLYLLLRIRILVYLRTRCGNSKIFYVSKITGHHFRG